MHRLTRQILRPFLFALLPLCLAACGSGSDSTETDAEALALLATPVFGEHSVVIDKTVTIPVTIPVTKSFGANGYGQLGTGDKYNKTTPVNVAVDKDKGVTFSAVSIGGAHSVALDTVNGGNVWTWGINSAGQLGDGTLVTKTSPVAVLPSLTVLDISGVKAISAGGKHTLAIAADDTVLAWGDNATGQLGNGTLVKEKLPVQVLTSDGPALAGVTAIAAGGDFSLALKSDGTVWAWGNNGNGQLGNHSFDSTQVPVEVVIRVAAVQPDPPPVVPVPDSFPPLTGIIAIAAGGSHALALKDDGTVYAWGYNEFGQLGDGTITKSNFAIAVVGTGPGALNNKVVTAISAGLDHSVAIDGANVYTWGYNYYGQLGNGAALRSNISVRTLQTVLIPIKDPDTKKYLPLTGIVKIVATGHHCIAETSTGIIWTWGRNSHGQLGDGTTVSRSTAKQIN